MTDEAAKTIERVAARIEYVRRKQRLAHDARQSTSNKPFVDQVAEVVRFGFDVADAHLLLAQIESDAAAQLEAIQLNGTWSHVVYVCRACGTTHDPNGEHTVGVVQRDGEDAACPHCPTVRFMPVPIDAGKK